MRKNLIAMSTAVLVGSLSIVGGAAANVLVDAGAYPVTDGTFVYNGTTAVSQSVTNNGIGHQLIIPYYNVQSGNATLINLTNTDTFNGKAVKVRFRGASNSDDVFDFQVYMSPGDVWTATITRGADGLAVLKTTDKSCTIPANVSDVPFKTQRLNPRLTGDTLAAETREGYVEIFNMADIPPRAITPADGSLLVPNAPNALFTTIKHVAGVAPCFTTTAGAAALNATAVDPATIAAARTLGFRAPTGTLFANWTIINVPKSGAASGEAVALLATLAGAAPDFANPGAGRIVFYPQTDNAIPVGVGHASVNSATADPSLRTLPRAAANDFGVSATGINTSAVPYAPAPGVAPALPIIAALSFDLPDLSTPYTGTLGLIAAGAEFGFEPVLQAQLLSRALATTQIVNEFITDKSIGAFTDWIFSSPTRRYSVALDYRIGTPATNAFVRAYTAHSDLKAANFTDASGTFGRDYFNSTNTILSTTGFAPGGQICVTPQGLNGASSTASYVDREEFSPSAGIGFVISPATAITQRFLLCGETSVLTFNAPAGQSVLGGEVARQDTATGTGSDFRADGWFRVGTGGLATSNAVGVPVVPFNGLPIIGKAVTRAGNGSVSANFGAAWEHRYARPVSP